MWKVFCKKLYSFFPWQISLKAVNLVCPWLLNSSVKKLIAEKTPNEALTPHFKISKENFYPENRCFVLASLWFSFLFVFLFFFFLSLSVLLNYNSVMKVNCPLAFLKSKFKRVRL